MIVHILVTQVTRHDPVRLVPCEGNVDERLDMKIIINVRITQGYEKWVELFHSADAVREEYGVTVLAYGHDKDDDSSVYQVLEIESMERMQEGLSNPAIAKMRTDAGVDLDSQKITFLVE
tara:strand:- start:1852 stop:2211 length:360 start_codon:yes stop_codon:yes gene_type:complete